MPSVAEAFGPMAGPPSSAGTSAMAFSANDNINFSAAQPSMIPHEAAHVIQQRQAEPFAGMY